MSARRWLPDGVEPWEIPLLDPDEVESVTEVAPQLFLDHEMFTPDPGTTGPLW